MMSSADFPIVPPPDAIDQEPFPIVVDEEAALDDQHDVKEDLTADSEEGDADDDDEDGTSSQLNDGVIVTKSNKAKTFPVVAVLLVILVVMVVLASVLGTRYRREKQSQSSSSSQTSPSTCAPPPSYTCSQTTAMMDVFNVTGNGATVVASSEGTTVRGEASGDLFGTALSVNCDATIVAVGSPQHDDRSGQVHVYQWVVASDLGADKTTVVDISKQAAEYGGAWMPLGQTLEGIEGSPDQFGHAISLSSDGQRLAISGRFADTTFDNGTVAENVGTVQVFQLSADRMWQPIGQVVLGEAANDQSGRSVQLNWDGSRMVVGASGNDATGNNAGHVRVFEFTTSNSWSQLGDDIDGESEEDQSGSAVALTTDGNVVAVGAYKNQGSDGATEGAGHVRVFTYDESTMDWSQVGSDINGDANGDWHGLSLALSGDGTRLVVGVPGSNDRFWPGVAKVYDLVDGTGWVQVGADLEGGGYSVDISVDGNRVALGSHRGFEKGPNTGQVLVYEYDSDVGSWTAILGEGGAILGDQGSMFGTVVGMSSNGERVVASAPATSGNGTDPSLAFVGSMTAFHLCPVGS